MPKKKVETKLAPKRYLSKADEWEALERVSEKMRKDPDYGIEVAKRAGILDENGQLTAFYRQGLEE